jgi:uncharacterized protein YjbI with pentapeptide repeats
MLGLRFDTSNEFGLAFSFENCNLNHASFFKTKIKKTVFKQTQLQETDFAACDLTGAVFDRCDLSRAQFDQTNLEKTDFRTSGNYSINPELNRMKKAKFSLSGLPGLLEKYDIYIED